MSSLVQLQQIFNEIQTCDSRAYTENLATTLQIISTDSSFLTILHSILACKRNTCPGRVSLFLERIFEELKNRRPDIFKRLFQYLLEFTNSKNGRTRKHSLRLVSMLLDLEKHELSMEILQSISERLFDKEASVRKEALKICLIYQESSLNDSLKIQGVLKDVLRYDQVHEIRKICLLQIGICPSTINCVIERCIDLNVNVRKIFWMNCFKKISIEDIPISQRIFLMKSAFNEREFDAKNIFLQFAREFGLDRFVRHFFCSENVYDEVIESLINSDDEYALTTFTPSFVHFLNIYYRFKENMDGRDSLNLMGLEEFLNILRSRCTSLEENINSNDNDIVDEIRTISGLFKLLSFYDIFNDSDRKSVLSIINHLLTKCSIKEVVEESVVLCGKICSKDIVTFLGSIIKRIRGTKLCFVVCECIMKHLPFTEMHEAIFQEIVVTNINEGLDILFWYLIAKPSKATEEFYLSFLPNKKILDGATDLVLLNIIDISSIYEQILYQASSFNENAVIPVTKLLLAKKIGDHIFFKNLLLIFYSTETEYIQQYLSVFFNEYLYADSSPLTDIFCDVMQLITENHKIFVDQSLAWIGGSRTTNGYQVLFFKICLFICNNYEEMKNRKFLFAALEKTMVLPSWESILTKKIIYVISLILKKRPRENVQALLTKLMEIDDGSPLETQEFKDLKKNCG